MNDEVIAGMQRWSTQSVEPERRLDYWRDAVCEGFLEMDVNAPAAAFHGVLESARLDCLAVSRVCSSAQHVFRTPRGISRARANYFYLLCKTDSTWFAEQDDRCATLEPGDLLLVDSRRRYGFHLVSTADTLTIELPTNWVERWLVRPGDHVARRIDGNCGWGSVLSRFVRELTPEFALRPTLPARFLTDQLGGLLALACEARSSVASDSSATELAGRVLRAIRDRHTEPGLTAVEVADGLRISERSLHRCLVGTGTTFGRALLESRIATAKTLLQQARFDRLTVAEIGFRAGFSDPSHFARVCRQHLGASPQIVRRRDR